MLDERERTSARTLTGTQNEYWYEYFKCFKNVLNIKNKITLKSLLGGHNNTSDNK